MIAFCIENGFGWGTLDLTLGTAVEVLPLNPNASTSPVTVAATAATRPISPNRRLRRISMVAGMVVEALITLLLSGRTVIAGTIRSKGRPARRLTSTTAARAGASNWQ